MRTKGNISVSLVISVLLFGTVGTALAGTIYVDDDASLGGNGQTWATAYKYLQDAFLTDATSGDQVWVAAGVYKPDQDEGGNVTPGDRTATFQLTNGVSLYGGFAGSETSFGQRDWQTNETILSGDLNGDDVSHFKKNGENSYHVVTGSYTDANAVIDGFTITAGNANGNWPNNAGGGMFTSSGSPTVTNCTFSGNSAGSGDAVRYGGGMYNSNSSPTVTNCTFSGNSVNSDLGDVSDTGDGGGMFNDGGSPTVTGCTFSENSAWGGGGMYNKFSSPTVTNCTFSNNSTGYGGGMFNDGGSPTLTGCTFSGNSAYMGGGGMTNWSSPSTVTNCVFSGNSTESFGGGMSNWSGSSPTVTNCTFVGNSAYSSGNGYGGGMYNTDSSPTVTNCVFSDNSASYGGDEIYNVRSSSTVTYSDIAGGYAGAGNIDIAPNFVDPDNDDYHLMSQAGRWNETTQSWVQDGATSPCIDAGNPGYLLGDEPNDANNLRINMGAYGGTAEASKTPAEWSLLADLTNDGTVNSSDLGAFVAYWLYSGECIQSDLNRNQFVDFVDFALFAQDWFLETNWYAP